MLFSRHLTDLTVKSQKSDILQVSCALGFTDLKEEGSGKNHIWEGGREAEVYYTPRAPQRQLPTGSPELRICPLPARTPIKVLVGTLAPVHEIIP